MSIINVFRRKTKFTIYLPRRGGRKLVGTYKFRDVDALIEKLGEIFKNYTYDRTLKEAKSIIIFNHDTGEEIKIDNPYYDESLEEEEHVTRVVNKRAEAEEYLTLKVLENLSNELPMVFSKILEIPVETTKKYIEEMIKRKEGDSYTRDIGNLFNGLANFIGAIVMLAKNKDQVIDLLSNLKEQGIDLRQIILSMYGGQVINVGGSDGRESSRQD